MSDIDLKLIDQARTVDRRSLISEARKIQRYGGDAIARKRWENQFVRKLSQSIDKVYSKSRSLIQPVSRGKLPVSRRWDEIAEVIKANQVSIVCGHTGSGKTTKIPQICLEMKLGSRGKIAHTQPRRIAARSVAARIAEELNVSLGDEVGYKVRFDERHGRKTDLMLLTDGMLLAEIAQDKYLNQYEVIIIDEAHERSLNIDFLLGYLSKILKVRSDLKIIITSATIDAERFSSHYGQAPVITVEGKTFPVDIIHRETDENVDLSEAIINAVDELDNYHYADTLVFLPTERDIREAARQLEKQKLPNTRILSLYARQSKKVQHAIFRPGPKRRIILSTNVAETSITVPRILNVIDSGLARISRYSYRSKIQRLPIEKISKASAAQRTGRCGRIDEGVCIRLYGRDDFDQRADYTEPEILRTSLAAVILKMESLNFGKIDNFPFIDPPETRMINDGYKLLFELKAIDQQGKITPFGKKMAQLPIDPRFACVLLHAEERKLTAYVLPIVCALAVGDIRERPEEARQKADQQQRLFMHNKSDLLWFTILFNRLWPIFTKSKTKARKFTQSHFLSAARTREWLSLYDQLADQLNVTPITDDAQRYDQTLEQNYRDIHCCLASGFLDYLGQFNTQSNDYTGTRSKRFSIFPGSYLFKKKPPQIMSIEMVESSKVYARQVAAIDLSWLEPWCRHLYKTTESDPIWKKKQGNVMVNQTVLLYGLPILSGKQIPYATKNATAAHQLFIQQALVTNDIHTRVRAVASNRDTYERLLKLEEKTRSRDIVIDEIAFAGLYAKQIPETVHSVASFEKWFFSLSDKTILDFGKQDFLLQDSRVDDSEYPEHIEIGAQSFPLYYEFNPGSPRDGITTRIKSSALNGIAPTAFDYLIPSMLSDKIEAVLRTLPKQFRKKLLPISEHSKAIHRHIRSTELRQDLLIVICDYLNQSVSLDVRPELFDLENLDDHFKMNFVITDDHDSVIDESRDLVSLQNKYAKMASGSFHEMTSSLFTEVYVDDFPDEIPGQYVVKPHSLIAFPAFSRLPDRDHKKSEVAFRIKLHDNQPDSVADHLDGTVHYIKSRLRGEIKKCHKYLPRYKQLDLQYRVIGTNAMMLDDICSAIILDTGLSGELPYTKAQMQTAVEQTRSEFLKRARDLADVLHSILANYHSIKTSLDESKPYYRDVDEQLDRLVYPGFIARTPAARLQDIVRFTAAVTTRIDKAALDLNRDQRWQAQVTPYVEILKKLADHQKIDKYSPDKLQELMFLIEEYRISLFAQNEIKTGQKVSPKRLDRLVDEIRRQY